MAMTKYNERSHRLIPSRYPPIGLFDEYGTPEDAAAAMELETMSNDRTSGALGRLNAIPKGDWALGKSGSNMAMAAFLHPAPGGGRFNTEALGAWYASQRVETAIQETLHHNERRLR